MKTALEWAKVYYKETRYQSREAGAKIIEAVRDEMREELAAAFGVCAGVADKWNQERDAEIWRESQHVARNFGKAKP